MPDFLLQTASSWHQPLVFHSSIICRRHPSHDNSLHVAKGLSLQLFIRPNFLLPAASSQHQALHSTAYPQMQSWLYAWIWHLVELGEIDPTVCEIYYQRWCILLIFGWFSIDIFVALYNPPFPPLFSVHTHMWQQVWWSKYINVFNLSLHFHPGKLGAKPDALTRQWDVYAKEEGVTYVQANPETPACYSPQITSTIPPNLPHSPSPPHLHAPPQNDHCMLVPLSCPSLAHCWIWKSYIPTY